MQNESFFALYKGLGAVIGGIVPKMAIRFSSFEMYKAALADENGVVSRTGVFFGKLATCLLSNLILNVFFDYLAGLAAGTTEALCVVAIADLIKIR